MSTTLDQIVAHTRSRIAESQRAVSRAQLEHDAQSHTPRGFRRALLSAAESDGLAVIAELKKASPSKGLIREDFPVGKLAAELVSAGASALSVLTEEKWFRGSLEDLQLASAAAKVPCLRKDFIVDEYQLLEARASHADAVLLIVAALTDEELQRLLLAARALALDVLVEAHDEDEIVRASSAGADMVGVNS